MRNRSSSSIVRGIHRQGVLVPNALHGRPAPKQVQTHEQILGQQQRQPLKRVIQAMPKGELVEGDLTEERRELLEGRRKPPQSCSEQPRQEEPSSAARGGGLQLLGVEKGSESLWLCQRGFVSRADLKERWGEQNPNGQGGARLLQRAARRQQEARDTDCPLLLSLRMRRVLQAALGLAPYEHLQQPGGAEVSSSAPQKPSKVSSFDPLALNDEFAQAVAVLLFGDRVSPALVHYALERCHPEVADVGGHRICCQPRCASLLRRLRGALGGRLEDEGPLVMPAQLSRSLKSSRTNSMDAPLSRVVHGVAGTGKVAACAQLLVSDSCGDGSFQLRASLLPAGLHPRWSCSGARDASLRPKCAREQLLTSRRGGTELLGRLGAGRDGKGSSPATRAAWFGAQSDFLHSSEVRESAGPALASKVKVVTLPIHSKRREIMAALRDHQVTLLQGETGSGKTTQVPKFVLDLEEELAAQGGSERRRPTLRIVVTQPRRIAAITVAKRVAEELGESVGVGRVGYKVRGTSLASPHCQLLFCTTGVLLRRLGLEGQCTGNSNCGMFSPQTVTHLIVDEVHERSCDTDLLLTFLREALPTRPKLRVLLMSATMDTNCFLRYFGAPVPVAGGGPPSPCHELEAPDWQQNLKNNNNDNNNTNNKNNNNNNEVEVEVEEEPEPEDRSKCQADGKPEATAAAEEAPCTVVPVLSVSGRCFPTFEVHLEHIHATLGRRSLHPAGLPTNKNAKNKASDANALEPDDDIDYELIVQILRELDQSLLGSWAFVETGARPEGLVTETAFQEGAVLVFLPGVGEIMRLVAAIEESGVGESWWVLPLHAGLPSEEQEEAFSTELPPGKLRKIIAATNVAETSVTVPDVTVVIDSCRERRSQVDRFSNTPMLREQWCALDALRQRRGRAGRVRPGVCLRLISQEVANRLEPTTLPEMQRMPLENIYLQVCACGVQDRRGFLAKTPDPPEEVSVRFAEACLQDLGCLQDSSAQDGLSALGRHLAALPCHPRIGKILVLGCLLSVPGPTLSICAALCGRSPLMTTQDQVKRQLWQTERDALMEALGQRSDHCAWAVFMHAWQSGRVHRRDLCRKYGLSFERMCTAMFERKHLCESLVYSGLLPSRYLKDDWCDRDSVPDWSVIRGALTGGLFPNIAHVERLTVDRGQRHQRLGEGRAARAKKLRYTVLQRSVNDSRDESYSKAVTLHPNSLIFGQDDFHCPWLAYFAIQQTTRLYVYDVSEVSPFAILLFGPEADASQPGSLKVGGWARFRFGDAGDPASAASLLSLLAAVRGSVQEALEQRLVAPGEEDLSARGGTSQCSSPSEGLAAAVELLRTNGLGFSCRE
ncbi:unnamed protein product, partial [Polarella glacialis]